MHCLGCFVSFCAESCLVVNCRTRWLDQIWTSVIVWISTLNISYMSTDWVLSCCFRKLRGLGFCLCDFVYLGALFTALPSCCLLVCLIIFILLSGLASMCFPSFPLLSPSFLPFSFLLQFVLLFFGDWVSLYGLGQPVTFCVDQGSLKLKDLPASWVLGWNEGRNLSSVPPWPTSIFVFLTSLLTLSLSVTL